jgi:hypothetical protein
MNGMTGQQAHRRHAQQPGRLEQMTGRADLHRC